LSSFAGVSAKNIPERINKFDAKGLELELLQYWENNIPNFSQDELIAGFRRLTAEVQQDLTIGPERATEDIKELLAIVVDRGALHVDLTLDPDDLDRLRPMLREFLVSIPAPKQAAQRGKDGTSETGGRLSL
jgi:hypothetical protein